MTERVVGRRRVLGYGAAAGVAAGGAGAVAIGYQAAVTMGGRSAVDGSVARLDGSDVQAARAVLERLLSKGVADSFRLTLTQTAEGAQGPQAAQGPVPQSAVDRFRISQAGHRISVSGSTTGAILVGVNWYLKYAAEIDVSLPGDSLSRLPARLPAPGTPIVGAAVVPHRFALNDTENGYAGAYRSWADWERTIDLLAFHGFNEVLVTSGHAEVYRRTFAAFGYAEHEMDAWIPSPAHQPWWLLGNIAGLGGPVDDGSVERDVELTRRIVDRLRELGMTPVPPGYYGIVPDDFAGRNPGARVVPQGSWGGGARRPDWLDTRDPVYARVAADFYRHQEDLYGPTVAVKMDLFHEGGDAGDVPPGDAARAVMTALQTARPGATWMMLGWEENPRRQVLDALESCGAACATGKLLVLDGTSDRFASFDREDDWGAVPYAFGTIPNFGGRSLLGGNVRVWAERFRPAEHRGLTGIAWLPEASGHDPAAFELFAELAWRADGIDLDGWWDAYAARRYGGADPHLTTAWRGFARTAYALEAGKWSHAQDSLFCAWPDLSAESASAGVSGMRYDAAAFQEAVGELLRADDSFRLVDAYRFDVVDFTRQALANHARVLLPQIKQAYIAKDRAAFQTLSASWLSGMRLLDRLLATDHRFLLGTWLGGAQGSDTPMSAAQYDARSLITVWGGRDLAVDLHDYAARELAGLVRDVYMPRWQRHFDALEKVLDGSRPSLQDPDWFAMDDAWCRRNGQYPTTPAGDPFAVAAEIWAYLPGA